MQFSEVVREGGGPLPLSWFSSAQVSLAEGGTVSRALALSMVELSEAQLLENRGQDAGGEGGPAAAGPRTAGSHRGLSVGKWIHLATEWSVDSGKMAGETREGGHCGT